MRGLRLGLLGLALWAIPAGLAPHPVSADPASADPAPDQAAPETPERVVLRGGQEIPTRDGFEVRGRQVIFTDAKGKLRSLPLAEVDLEASRTPPHPAAAGGTTEHATADPPRPILVLENDDLPSAQEAARKRSREAAETRRRELDLAAQRSRAENGSGGGRRARPRRPSSATPEGTTAGLAQIGHWTHAPNRQAGGLEITGRVVNPSPKSLDRVTVRLEIRDEDGELVRTGRAFVDRKRLAPNQSTGFRYVDPGLTNLDDLRVEFRVTARALSWGARPHVEPGDIPTFQGAGGG